MMRNVRRELQQRARQLPLAFRFCRADVRMYTQDHFHLSTGRIPLPARQRRIASERCEELSKGDESVVLGALRRGSGFRVVV